MALCLVAGCSLPDPVRVMSFNIRYGTAEDGPNRWSERKALVYQAIRDYDADLLGLQEALDFQLVELCEEFPDYEAVGVGRLDGERRGEFVPILFRNEVFELVGSGHFWLSPSPKRVGSVGWDASTPRLATWAELRFRRQPNARIHVINTHLDHEGVKARTESARLLRMTAETLGGMPLIVMGDFNCAPGSEPYRLLTARSGNLAELRDPYAELGRPEEDAGTYHGFAGRSDGPRIDWILHSRRFEALSADVAKDGTTGPLASDHFPVTATLRLRPATRWGML
jgi:endonuclease/exonuclease/phosphatase family metal-dependent hydrolase